MKYDCLIIDDEKVLADSTCEYLNMFDVKAYCVYGRSMALDFFKENTTSLILLDINLSDGSGFELCKRLREDMNIPILFISARNTDDDKIIALNIGGDDYIEKPYSLQVLLAKVKVIIKRFSKPVNEYSNDHFRVSFDSKKLFVDGKETKLTLMEYKLLKYFIQNKGRAVTKEQIFNDVWEDKFTQDGTLTVHIRHLREYIELDPNKPKYITTVWGEGYLFED